MAGLLETYLRELREIRSSGAAVKETSFYGPLANLLNEVGKTLKPRVRCIISLKNQGAGLPDGGLFTLDQLQAGSDPLPGQVPGRGVIEVKGTGDDVMAVADSEQVVRYWERYRQVFVTNYRDFVLVGRDADGRRVTLETYRLAPDEATFWRTAASPHRLVAAHGERFTEYLMRVMLHAAPLASPSDVAWFLASYARDAKARVATADLPALKAVRTALEEALGLTFEGRQGEHFFQSTLVQTLFYGVFSAWVLWSKEHPPSDRQARFDWKMAAWSLHVPMVRALFEQVAMPSRLGPLHLVEILDWTAEVLNRVDRASFFAQFEEGHAVQYFYEPFLQAFDPELRQELGVWYTPPEIVRYMVERVDRTLREELEIEAGLADPRVYVLDPCCGTGAYLVEVLRRIASTLSAAGADALAGHDIRQAATSRVFGFEILPAPFVVAHLQLGLLLQDLGAPLDHTKNERAGIFLTNALAGWDSPQAPKAKFLFPELEEERDAAEQIKRDKPILVVIGNPPYNSKPKKGKASILYSSSEAASPSLSTDPYKQGLSKPVRQGGWGIKKFNLDDLYVRFFRLAEHRIAERTGRGVVCFISNFSYLGDPSFVVMRQRFLAEFDRMWFDCLNGDSRETGKRTPEGRPDPSVFSTEHNRQGIRVGTAVGLLVRGVKRRRRPTVRFRHFWGVTKRADLVKSLAVKRFDSQYQPANPDRDNCFSFRPSSVAAHYREWPKVTDLCGVAPSNGLMEKRGGALIDLDRDRLEARMRAYFNSALDWEQFRTLGQGLIEGPARFDAKLARKKAQVAESFDRDRIIRYALRPFDVRWCYYTGVRPVWNEPRPSLRAQCWPGNRFFMTRPAGVTSPEGIPVCFTRLIGDNDFLRGHAYYFPIQLKNGVRLQKPDCATLFDLLEGEPEADAPVANLSKWARDYYTEMGVGDPDTSADVAELIWMHALAIGHAPAYLAENADGLRECEGWPRIPLPETKDALLDSAALGRQVAALLDTEGPVRGVTSPPIRAELRGIAVVSQRGPEPLDLSLTAGWGYKDKKGAIMPGRGQVVERDYAPEEATAIRQGARTLGLTEEQALTHLGVSTADVALNDDAYWRNVPARVWDYTIGGYPVVKKWLSYRERPLLGRPLATDEAREVSSMARRIAALLLLEPALDANYATVKQSTYAWPASPGGP
jgi:hypothetical protein